MIFAERADDRGRLFSVYMLDNLYGWVATHRLPRSDAFTFAAGFRKCSEGSITAIVPEGDDPLPYLQLAEEFEAVFA